MPRPPDRLTRSLRRQSLCLGHVNGVLWAGGNALTSGTLLIYLAQDMGARGLSLSMILAAPSLAGVLRIFAPWLIHAARGIKPACVALFLCSYFLLLGQPVLGVPSVAFRPWALPALVTVVCVHQLLEYIGQACLWAWLGELTSRRLRGRYFARRQVLQLAITIPALFVSGWLADHWRQAAPQGDPARALWGYVIPAAAGAALLFLSVVPLAFMAPVTLESARTTLRLSTIVGPWRDARFRWLLLYGAWVAMANGVTQAAQNIYPKQVLGLGVLPMAMFRVTMQLGQMGYSQWAGRVSDVFGNRPVLILSQGLVSLGPIFYFLASREQPWWLWGAWICWSAFAGLNVCLPSFLLKVSSREDHAAYIATYFGVTNVVYACYTVGGGALHSTWSKLYGFSPAWHSLADYYMALFFLGAILRGFGVVILLGLAEPGAWRWPDILARRAPHGIKAEHVADPGGAG